MGGGCSSDCDSWVFDCRPLTSRHNRRVKSRDAIAESSELNDLKELRLVYPLWQAGATLIGRTIGRPAQWKADLHAFALSLLPAVVAFIMTLVASGNIGATFIAIMVLYAFTFGTVVFIKGFSKEVDDKAARNKVGISLFILVVVALALAAVGIILGILSGDPVIQGLVALIGAAVTALISHKPLALDPKYLVEAKKSPPLFSDREKRVWQKAAAVYGVLVVAALPRLLPENVTALVKEVLRTAGEGIPYAISLVGVEALLLVLIYCVFK